MNSINQPHAGQFFFLRKALTQLSSWHLGAHECILAFIFWHMPNDSGNWVLPLFFVFVLHITFSFPFSYLFIYLHFCAIYNITVNLIILINLISNGIFYRKIFNYPNKSICINLIYLSICLSRMYLVLANVHYVINSKNSSTLLFPMTGKFTFSPSISSRPKLFFLE